MAKPPVAVWRLWFALFGAVFTKSTGRITEKGKKRKFFQGVRVRRVSCRISGGSYGSARGAGGKHTPLNSGVFPKPAKPENSGDRSSGLEYQGKRPVF
jgi:hypothetical protein